MKNNVEKKVGINMVQLWEILLLVGLAVFFIDTYVVFGAFFITIPAVIIIAAVATVFAIKEKKYIFIPANVLLAIVPVVVFYCTPW